ncbi:MAG: flippase [Bacteroidota bacterium]
MGHVLRDVVSFVQEECVSSGGAQLARNSLWNLAGLAGSLAVNFISVPILVHRLGNDQFGLLGLVLSMVSPLGLLDFGMSDATVKYVAESIGRNDLPQVERYFRSTLMFNIVVGVLGSLAITVLAPWLVHNAFHIAEDHQQTAMYALGWVAAMWCFTQVRQTFISLFTAHQRYDVLNIATTSTQIVTVLSGLTALWLGGGLLDVVMAQCFAVAASTVFWMFMARRFFPYIWIAPSMDRVTFKSTMGFGVWQMLNNLGGVISQQSQRWLLGSMLPVASVGYYNIALQLSMVPYLPAGKIGQVLFPQVSYLQGQNREREAGVLMVNATWMLTILSLGLFVPLAVFAPQILTLWIGPEVSGQTSTLLRILCLGNLMGCLFQIPNYFLLGTGRAHWLAAMSFFQGLLTLLGCLVFIPRIGLQGAGWGMVLGTLVHFVILSLIWVKIMRHWLPSASYAAGVFGPYVIGVALAIIASTLLSESVVPTTWVWVIAVGAGVGLLSFGLLALVDRVLPGGSDRRTFLMNAFGKIFKRHSAVSI